MVAVDLDELPFGVVRLAGTTTEVLDANQGAAEALGRPSDALVGTALTDHLDDLDAADLVAALSAHEGATGDQHRPDVVVARSSGTARWVELAGGPVGDDLVVAVRDVTDDVRRDRVLREAVEVAVVVDDQGMRTWGPVGRMYPEGTPADLQGSVAERIHPEDLATALGTWQAVRDEPDGEASLRLRINFPTIERWGAGTMQIKNRRLVPGIDGMLIVVHQYAHEKDPLDLADTPGAFLSVAEAAPVGVIMTGSEGLAVYFNAASRRLLPGVGTRPDGGFDRDWVARVRPQDQDEVRTWVEATVAEGVESSRVVCVGEDDGRWLLVTIAPRLVDGGGTIGFVVTLQDITAEVRTRHELEAARDELAHLATHDPLTGLGNRALLDDALQRAVDAAPGQRRPLGVVACDLDGFKAVNDRHGHHAGDLVLVAVADRLRAAAGPDDLIARVGGDEFLVVVPDATTDVLDALGERVAAAIAAPVPLPEGSAAVGASVGTALLDADESTDQLLQRADAAMYGRKQAARPS